MRYKDFGRTGKKVSVLGFGGMRFDPRDEDLAIQTVQRAAERGINYFDTAPGYCGDRSEPFIGDALAAMPESIRGKAYVSTKSYIAEDPTADAVIRRIDKQLKRLHRDKIDFYHMWSILNLDHFHRVMAKRGPFEGAVRAREQSLVGHICCSTHASGEDIAAMVKADVFEGFTLGYNILNHTFRQKGLKAAAAAGRAVVTMNPLGGGMLTKDELRLSVFKESETDSFVAAALRFNLSHPEITIVLSGMKNPTEVEENVSTAESVIEPDPSTVERMINTFEALGESFCTTCGYCLDYCPEKIQIHLYAKMWDQVRMKQPEEARRLYRVYLQEESRWLKGKRASDCTECGECEEHCTQKLSIREYMRNIAGFLREK